jgi:hypothetical protein
MEMAVEEKLHVALGGCEGEVSDDPQPDEAVQAGPHHRGDLEWVPIISKATGDTANEIIESLGGAG